jgi:uncharacterized protein (TIGR00299 family) protein
MSGLSGDMILGALIDAGAPPDFVQAKIKSLGLPDFELSVSDVKKNGFRATKVDFIHEEPTSHRHLGDILKLIDQGDLQEAEADLAREVFKSLAEAEAKVHGSTIDKVHFHEVGAVDSIADIVGTAIAMTWHGIEAIFCDRIPLGSGTITIDHGTVSLPAPATAQLLIGIPTYQTTIKSELTTPTGAAIAKTTVSEFGIMPPMTVEKIGLGAGTRDLPNQANVLRILIGDTNESGRGSPDNSLEMERIAQLQTNIDDCTGEVIGYCCERLFDAGALEVFTTAIGMKKNRPAILLTVLCRQTDIAVLQKIIFSETSTLGIRRSLITREVLPREIISVQTEFGSVSGKQTNFGDKVRFEPEYDDCAAIAIAKGVGLDAVMRAAVRAFERAD